jgi:hypothetical protein
MGSDKICRFCKGTGVILCTTGKDGEMAVSCSCRREKAEKKDALKKKTGMPAIHVNA